VIADPEPDAHPDEGRERERRRKRGRDGVEDPRLQMPGQQADRPQSVDDALHQELSRLRGLQRDEIQDRGRTPGARQPAQPPGQRGQKQLPQDRFTAAR